MRTVYVIGYPGAGKTSAVTRAVALLGLHDHCEHDKPVPHVRHSGDPLTRRRAPVWTIGKQRLPFGGTDTLGMAINPRAIRWVRSLTDPGADRPDVLVGEGDRLANLAFLEACPDLTVVKIDVPRSVAQQRATERAEQFGALPQSESWMKGRWTKVDNLSTRLGGVVRIDGEQPATDVALDLMAVIR